jgi:tetratricopeptide (TPR) repeat protein
MAELSGLAEQRHRDPARVLGRADELLPHAADPEAVASCHWVAALALHELGRMPEAIDRYRDSIAAATGHDLRDVESRARGGLAVSLVSAGDAAAAAAEIESARRIATPATRGVVEMLFGLVQQRTGRLAEAQATYSRALRRLEEAGDLVSIARLRVNRGALRAYRGDSTGAVEDLSVAVEIATRAGLPVLTAMAAHNLGFARGRRGDLAGALAAFAHAEEAYADLDHPASLVAVLEADRCEVLLLAGLVAEAREAAQRAVEGVARTGDISYATECRLLLARALLAGGRFGEASVEANAAAAVFREAGRLPWAALAEYAAIQADVLAVEEEILPPPGLLERCREVAAELERRGWPVEAVHVRTFVGRLALALDESAVARAELAGAAGARRRGTADLRARAWHASALLHLAEGDRPAAKRALARGLRVVEQHQASLGATELRARAAGHGAELARLGVRLAVEERRPAELLRWAERWRASSLRHPLVLPPADDRLVADLAELRRLRAELREAALGGAAVDSLERAAITVEAAIRHRSLESSGDAGPGGGLDIAALRRRLGARVLVEYVALEGRLWAVTLTPRRSRLVELGAIDEVDREREFLAFALRRRLRGRAGADDQLLEAASGRLDELLVAPLGLPVGSAVVIVPTGSLHRLPWGCLPGLASRPLTVAPSAALWSQERPEATRGGERTRVLLVAGPDLPGAEAEVTELARLYPRAEVLTGADATAAAVLRGFERSDLVHLAAHGRFRSDSPLFSSVLLADGPLTVHDVERLPRSPRTVVLASCNAGVSGIESGDELVGTAATLVTLGVRTIVAPVASVPDTPTAAFMGSLHRGLRAGLSPAAALAAARGSGAGGVAAAFLCIGRDDALSSRTTR